MAVLRFSITKRSHEWEAIEMLITAASPNKRISPKGKGFSRFLAMEMNRAFKPSGNQCPDTKVAHVKKNFTIKIDDDVYKQIYCEAQQLGIDPGVLIAKKILDPHLTKTTAIK